MNLAFTVAAFAVALGVLIVIHEFGHFLAARRCGVKVLRFSVGFGKPLMVKRSGRDGTEWALAAFPLGGYVKMLDEAEGEVPPHELGRAFNRQPVWKRFLIVAAGPAANFLLAIVLYWVLFMHGIPGVRPMLGAIPPGSAAAQAGLAEGDLITAVDGEVVVTWQDTRWLMLKRVMEMQPARLQTRGEHGEISFHTLETGALTEEEREGDFLTKLGMTHYRPALRPQVGTVMVGSAAERAGLREGDEILAVDGQAVASWEGLVKRVQEAPGRELRFDMRRGDARLSLTVTPSAETERGRKVGKIGIGPKIDRSLERRLLTEVRYPALRALGAALHKTWDTSVFSLQMLGKMVVGQLSLKNISGPITIADYAGQSAHMGWLPYLSFLALISISLGVLNLLPIPLLDGGHLMYYMAEIVKGSPVSERVMELGQKVGMAVLLALMAFAFYNDINRLLSGQ